MRSDHANGARELGAVIRQAALPLLIALVYLNISTILVRQYDVPSILRVVMVVLTIIAVTEGGLESMAGALVQPLTFLLASYVAVLLLTTTFARHPHLADQRLIESMKSFGIFLLIVALASSWTRLRLSAYALVASAAFLSLLGIYQTITGSYARWFGGFARVKNAQIYGDVFQPRIAGPLGDPNFFAQILLIAVPIALFIGWESPRRMLRWLAFACAAIITAATLLTYSRGGMLALGCIFALALIAHRVDKRRLAAAAIAVVLLLLVLPSSFTRRFVTIEQILPGITRETLHPDASFEKRKLLTAAAWQTFKDNPFLGVGAGNYTVWFDHYAEQVGSEARDYDDPGEVHYPHSLYLEIAAETGIVGLIIFAVIIAVTMAHLRIVHRALVEEGQREPAGLVKALELAMIGYLVSSLFLHGHFQRYLWLLFGFAAALDRLMYAARREEELAAAADTL